MIIDKRRVLGWIAAAGLAMVSGAGQAQGYPTRPITWIVPFAAGGPTDAMARDVADHVAKALGQTILIENSPGAGGTIGAAKVARAKPDGYTMLVGHLGYMGAAPSLYKKLNYDPRKDFDPVLRFPDTPMVLLVGANSPFKSAQELVDYGRKNPGMLNFGNAGVGSTSHLIAALFASRAGMHITPVSYKGAAPAMTDLVGGQVQAMFDQTNTAMPQLAGGRLRAIGVTSIRPIAEIPSTPSLGQTVLPGFEAATWYGIYAPRGTPVEAIQKVYQAYVQALKDDGWKRRMTMQGIRLLPDAEYAPAAFRRFTAAEIEVWRKVATEAKISLD